MTTKIKARFYVVVGLNEHQADFEACLKKLVKLDAENLACEAGDATIQAGELKIGKNRISGDLVRLQADDFPTLIEKARAKPKKLRLAQGGFLGHHSCFSYDPGKRVLAYQFAQNSVSLGRFGA